MVERKFCTSCQVERAASGFKLVKTGPVNRWRCEVCLKRSADQKYKGKKNEK
jgi:hypothetical protein